MSFVYGILFFIAICICILVPIKVSIALSRRDEIPKAKYSVKDEIIFREDRLKKYNWIDASRINTEIEELKKMEMFFDKTPYIVLLFSDSFSKNINKLKKYRKMNQDSWIIEREKNEELIAKREVAEKHQSFLDQDSHEEPAEYLIGRHALETLALRYGAVFSGRKMRIKKIRPAGMYDTISKTENIVNDCYLVSLCDLRNRKALAIIEKGTDYIKTFYPFEKQWFDINFDLETVLKGNENFSIKEIARFHIDRSKRPDERNPVERENTVWER